MIVSGFVVLQGVQGQIYMEEFFKNLEKRKRQRFSTARIASSDKYELSSRVHRNVLQQNHEKVKSVAATIAVPFMMVFGKMVALSQSELEHAIAGGMNVIWR
jgi:outer membrane lipopolysaccharide assembly protein LptE/RlpB